MTHMHRPQALWLLALIALSSLPTHAAEADATLGRLFNTPQRRASLDGMRERNLRITPDAQQQDSIRLDGIVLRSDGRSTVWLNQQAITDRASSLRADPSSAQVPISGERSVRLRVGETLRTPSTSESQP